MVASVALSQCTDPLWPDPGASIEKRIEVTLRQESPHHVKYDNSQVDCFFYGLSEAVHIVTNVRIEKAERANTGNMCTSLHSWI